MNGTFQSRSANVQSEVMAVGGATTPGYDANGNMAQAESGLRYMYDGWNRLVAVKNSAGTTTLATYSYDGLNRRVTSTVSGTTTDLYYSSGWQVVEEQVGGATRNRYVWSPVYVDALVLRDRDTNADGTPDERLWVQQDANWNVTALVDGSGVVQERNGYDPFGGTLVLDANWATDADGQSDVGWVYAHQGLRWDGTATLYDNRNRWFSPSLGRFTSLDPIRYDAGDVNLYRYVGNGPTTAVDPNGLWRIGFEGHFSIGLISFSIDVSYGTGGGNVGIGAGLGVGAAGAIYVDPIGSRPAAGSMPAKVASFIPAWGISSFAKDDLFGFNTQLFGPPLPAAPDASTGGFGIGIGKGVFLDLFGLNIPF